MYKIVEFSIAEIDFEMRFVETELYNATKKFLTPFLKDDKLIDNKEKFIWELKLDSCVGKMQENVNESEDTVVSEKWFAKIDFNNSFIKSEVAENNDGYLYALICGVYFKIFKRKTSYLWCHSCGVLRNDKCYIFTGVSGAGKTTIANKCKQFQVLSDETVILKVENEKIYAFGTPFSSDNSELKGTNQKGEVTAIFIISHGEKSTVKRIAVTQAFKEIMKTNIDSNIQDFFNKQIGMLWEAVLLNIPCYKFEVNINDDIWEVIDNDHL